MLGIVLLVLFVVVMFVWFLALVGAGESVAKMSPWLAWCACLFLGIVVFLSGYGLVVLPR